MPLDSHCDEATQHWRTEYGFMFATQWRYMHIASLSDIMTIVSYSYIFAAVLLYNGIQEVIQWLFHPRKANVWIYTLIQ